MSDKTKLPIDLIERAREMEDRLLEFIGNQHRRAVANILVCGENYCACRQRANMKEISRAREATGIRARLDPRDYVQGQVERLCRVLGLPDEAFVGIWERADIILSHLERESPAALHGSPSYVSGAIVYIAAGWSRYRMAQRVFRSVLNLSPAVLSKYHRRILGKIDIIGLSEKLVECGRGGAPRKWVEETSARWRSFFLYA